MLGAKETGVNNTGMIPTLMEFYDLAEKYNYELG